jgi:3-methyladenine DNA glycosylase AlkD
MNRQDILKLLEEQKNERGIKHWKNAGIKALKSYGIGATKLKAIAKKVGKNHALALELWNEPIYEFKVLATLMDNPKEITREQIQQQVADLGFWMLSHAYCNYLLPKYPKVQELAEEWIESKNDLERRCGWQLYYQIAKNNKKLGDDYFLPLVQRIEKDLQKEENFVKDAMNNALWSIGMRSKYVNTQCIETAAKIGKVEVDYGDNSCQAINVTQHLKSERVQKKFNS